MKLNRFAVYYTPHRGALAEFGAAWLGWDIASGKSVAHPQLAHFADTGCQYNSNTAQIRVPCHYKAAVSPG